MVKLNWDAYLNVKDGRVGIGLITKDSQGNRLVVRSLSLEVQTDVAGTEVMAVANAIIFCKEMGYNNVIF
jgi:hypothetical protein